MLLPWSDRVRIFLHPRHLLLERQRPGWRWRTQHRQYVACDMTHIGAPWEAPLSMLQTVLREPRWRDARTEVVLSNHFVRFALIPWSSQLSNRQERAAWLRHCFINAFGEPARNWSLRMGAPYPDAPSLASGIDPKLLEALRIGLEHASLRLSAVQPYLMVAANESRRHIGKTPVWLAVAEPGRLCLALLDGGVWKSVGSHAVELTGAGPLVLDLETLLAREAVLQGDARLDWPVALYWPAPGATPVLPGRKVMRMRSRWFEDAAAGGNSYQQAMWA